MAIYRSIHLVVCAYWGVELLPIALEKVRFLLPFVSDRKANWCFSTQLPLDLFVFLKISSRFTCSKMVYLTFKV